MKRGAKKRNPVEQFYANRDAWQYLEKMAGEGWSVPMLVNMVRERYPSIDLTMGNLDSVCFELGIKRVKAKPGGSHLKSPWGQ